MRQLIKRSVLGRGQLRPTKAAGEKIVAGVTEEIEKGIVRFRNPVELTGNDPRDRRSFSSRSCRSLKSRTTTAKPCNSHP